MLGVTHAPAAEHVLGWREDLAAHTFPVQTEGLEVTFAKEPALGKDVVRGALRVGSGPRDFIGFAWDRGEGKLYVDRNANLDLTDDPEGVYTAADRSYVHRFDDIVLKRTLGEVPLAYRLSFLCSPHGQISVTVRSGWHGAFAVGDDAWELSWVDNLNGVLDQGDLLILGLPGSDRVAEEAEDTVPPSFRRLPLAENLSVNGVCFTLNPAFGFRVGPDVGEVTVETGPASGPTGTVRVTGELKGRVILEGPGRGAVLTRTDEAIAVPAGTYSQPTVALDGGAQFLRFTARAPQEVNVTEGGSLDLALGGPLRNSARVQASGGSVRFDYELRGIGGERYKAFINDFTQKPKLAVYRGDEQVHSANFEYG
jgi:hypothetical protein